MSSLLHQFRWLYALALLQLLGGPLVVSVLMQVGGPGAESVEIVRIVALPVEVGGVAMLKSGGGEAWETTSEVPWREPVGEGTSTKGKMQAKWSVSELDPIRVFPPMAEKLAVEWTNVRCRTSGAGPPAPPPRVG